MYMILTHIYLFLVFKSIFFDEEKQKVFIVFEREKEVKLYGKMKKIICIVLVLYYDIFSDSF